MPNGTKNIGSDDIELLPPEFQKPEERKKKEERPEVKLFVPEMEEKSQKPTFMGKFFSSKPTPKPAPASQGVAPSPKPAAEPDLSVFKIQREIPKSVPPSPPPPVSPVFSRPTPPPALKPVLPPAPPRPPMENKPLPVPKPPQKVEPPRQKNNAPRGKFSKPPGEKIPPDITLIPEEESADKEKRKTSKKAILLASVAIILALCGGGLYFILGWYQGQADLDLQKIEADLGAAREKNQALDSERGEAQNFQKKLKIADKILGNHIYWTNLFSFLEKNTVADVYFVNLIGGDDGQIVMSGVAKSYAAMARQITAFRAGDQVSKVSVLSASASVDTEGNVTEINFDAKLQFNPKIFLK